MVELKNKPRVFLSHSKRDISFINNVCEDLRKCQIEPWIDDIEIRHGQPWLDEIFENGIPTCDSILVYLTENSLQSAMVKKEIDASIIRKLKDNKIGFLPYVSDTNLRDKLRPDLQTLQIPEWNNENYSSLLPRVVSVIWQGFMEKKISQAIADEKVQKLEIQLELENIKQGLTGGIFTPSEEREYSYIWDVMNRIQDVVFILDTVTNDQKVKNPFSGKLAYSINVRTILPFLASPQNYEYSGHSIKDILHSNKPGQLSSVDVFVERCPDLATELLMFGLIERRELPRSLDSSGNAGFRSFFSQDPTIRSLAYTAKFDRFNYWLAYKGFIPKKIEWVDET